MLKFGTFDISNPPISILMSKIIFMKYLPSVRPKRDPKLKNAPDLLKFGTFGISNIPTWILISKSLMLIVRKITVSTNEIYHKKA